MTEEYLIVSLKHTREEDPYICFWKSINAGYAYRKEAIGIYSHDVVSKAKGYYNNHDSTLAVNKNVFDDRWIYVERGWLYQGGLIIENTPENWELIHRECMQ